MSKKAGLGMMGIAWIILLVFATAAIHRALLDAAQPAEFTSERQNDGRRQVTLRANRQHHYVARILINSHPVNVLIDTGATNVVIPAALAGRLQLPEGRRGIATTANGEVRVIHTVIERIEIGAIELRNIRAVINPGMSEDAPVLLGMSALKNIEMRQQGGRLILVQ